MQRLLRAHYVIVFLAGISLSFPQLADAFPNKPFPSPLKQVILAAVFDITDEQLEAFENLRAEMEVEIEPLAEEMKELGVQLPEVLFAETIDVTEATEKLQQIAELQCQIQSIGADTPLEAVQILTPEQRETILGFAEKAIALLEYIADYPNWEKIKEDFGENIKPAVDDLLQQKVSRRLGIDLTDEQLEVFENLRAEMEVEIEPLAEEMKELGVQLPEVLFAETIDVTEATEKLQQIAELQCQIQSIGADTPLEAVQILTPEQREVILGEIEKKRERVERWKNIIPPRN